MKSAAPGTALSRLPQGSTIILERCEVDSYGSARNVQPERRSCIWLEQIPSVLIVVRSQATKEIYDRTPFSEIDCLWS